MDVSCLVDDGEAAARYTLEHARRVLTATKAAKRSAARAQDPYRWVVVRVEFISICYLVTALLDGFPVFCCCSLSP